MSTGSAFLSRGRWKAACALALWTGLSGLPHGAYGRPAGPTDPAAIPDAGPATPALAPTAAPAAPTAAPASTAAPAPTAAPAAPTPDHGVGRPDALREVDRRIGDLKDQIFRAKARLSLLSERHLRTSAGGVVTAVSQRNQLGMLYRLVRVVYEVDGREVFRRDEENNKPIPTGDLPIWDGPLRPGEHTLSATLLYRGNGSRVFSYFDEYTYSVSAAHRFVVQEGSPPRIRVLCREKGSFATTSLENRPSIEFVTDDSKAPKGTAEKGADASR
ncbi:MAG: hypothetical protein JNJ46_01295 [Myxococcales bacterium]|nr:hypothetical protein [Myxococcales bacterium]